MAHDRHEWGFYLAYLKNPVEGFPVRCITDGCDGRLGWDEIIRRLNAVERLPEGRARTAASLIRGHTVKDDLKAYAAQLDTDDAQAQV